MLWSYHVDAGQVTVGLNWEKQRNCRIHTIGWFPPNGYMYKNMIPAQRGVAFSIIQTKILHLS